MQTCFHDEAQCGARRAGVGARRPVYRLGWTGWNVDYRYDTFPSVMLAAVVLLAGGVAALAVDRAAVRRIAADSDSDVSNIETGQTRA